MSKAGAVILTAGEKTNGLGSMYVIEGRTVIERILGMLKDLGTDPVTLVIGDQKEIIEKHIKNEKVRIIYGPQSEQEDMLESIKLGIRDLRGLCGRILIIRTDIPAFSEETLKELLKTDMPLARPLHEGHAGNPVIVGSEYFDTILSYEGDGGLQGAFDEKGIEFAGVEVDDPGVLLKSDDQDDFIRIREIEAREHSGGRPYSCVTDLKLRNAVPFFNNESALLLEMIDDTHSIKKACDCIHISYSKAWTMIRLIENETGIRFVIKKIGGFMGGNTVLTDEGREFVKDYRRMIKQVQGITDDIFRDLFGKYMR